MKKLTIVFLALTSIIILSSCSNISANISGGSSDNKTDAALEMVKKQDGILLNIETVIDDDDIVMDVQIVDNAMSVKANINGESRTIIQNETATYVLSDDIKMGYMVDNDSDDELIKTLNNFKNFSNISSSVIEKGNITIDDIIYDYEMFNVTTLLDTTVKYCYNQESDLCYIVFTNGDIDKTVKINDISLNVDTDSFEIPKDYNISKE
jgi:PBP1b-binding outer membrane lipoprotein LpoB